jgi:hypothetical protein
MPFRSVLCAAAWVTHLCRDNVPCFHDARLPFYAKCRCLLATDLAPHLSGFTRASSLGPIADFMDRQGGSVARVLRDVDLPFAHPEQPEIVIPLREHFRFLERAARRTGDAYFGARLGQVVRIKELSAFGAWVCAAETLLHAIERAHAGLNIMLQTSTVLTLERRGPTARWSIEFLEPETDGRHHNELLGISYLIDTVRTYAGRRRRPHVVIPRFQPKHRGPGLRSAPTFRTAIS